MRKTTSTIAILAAILMGSPSSLYAQAPSQLDSIWFANISAGGQVQTRTFTSNNTITVFGEDGVVTANQNVGTGLVFDASVGLRMGRHLAIAVGVSTFNGKGDANALARIPDQLLFGTFRNTTFTASGLKQTDVAFNIQLLWIKPLTDKIDLAIFGGPSVIRVKQEVASVTVNTSTQVATPSVETQSKTTAKAGTIGADLIYKLTRAYGIGVFVRYAGGEAALPAAPTLKVGGVQVGAGLRVRF